MNISVVIPSFNGQKLLAKNLPSVLSGLKPKDEIIIVDDAGSDKTAVWLKQKFNLNKSNLDKIFIKKYGQNYDLFIGETSLEQTDAGQTGVKKIDLKQPNQKIQIKLLQNKKNLRFGASVNRGFFLATYDHVWLLNNDVAIKPATRKYLVKHFKNKQVFAVACLEIEKNLDGTTHTKQNQSRGRADAISSAEKKIKGGKNKLWFDKGIFCHSRADDFKSGETAWACGGSAMFDRNKWLKLDGFNKAYYPAYWEDIDLSFRAKKQGWRILFEEKAVVYHNHESTNLDVFGKQKLEKISWKNAHKFVWRNGTFWQKIANLLWRPYWWWHRNKNSRVHTLIFWTVLLSAFLLRFYKLAQVPHGMTWDEAAIAYNGYAIFNTRRDEWLQRLPISFQSFGDYKAPLAIYLNGFFTHFFGMNLWAVRLPFAIAGALSVLGIYFLANSLFQNFKLKTHQTCGSGLFALTAMAILALSPWHLHFSRVGFESGLALMFLIWGVYLFNKFILLLEQNKKAIWQKIIILSLAGLNFTASIYSYHSSKIAVPLILLTMLIFNFKKLKRKFNLILIPLVINLSALFPLLKDSFQGKGLTRAGTLIIFKEMPLPQLAVAFISQFFAHLSPKFLILGLTDNLRHGAGKWSVFLISSFVLLILAVYFAIRKQKVRKIFYFSLAWIIFSLIPAALSQPTPHANRALLVLPGFIFLISLAFIYLKNKKLQLFFIGLHLTFFSFYLNYYYQQFAKLSADDFKDGYLEAMQIAYEYEQGKNDKPEVDKIIFSSNYGQPYIYALFVRQTNPIWYQGGSLVKYEFKDKINTGDLMRTNALVVAGKDDELLAERANHLVYGSDGQVKFKLYYVK